MQSETIALLLGMGLVLFFFVLKVGLFNSDSEKHKIKKLNCLSEFPIDGTTSIIPLYIILSHDAYKTSSFVLLGIPFALIVLSIQILIFKSTILRTASPDTKFDHIVIPITVLLSYTCLSSVIYMTYLVSQRLAG